MKFDDDIWPQLKASGHTWKFKPRYDGKILLIELHSTRGGVPGHTAAQEYESTKNWFLSPNNVQDGGRWGACSSVIIGGGRICQVMPDEYWPSFCLGHADPVGLAIEIGQTFNETPFDLRDLELAAQYCAEKSRQYGIPVRVLPFLSADNHEAPGYVRHDRSANGGYYGKSDPGKLFDDRKFEARVREIMVPPQQEDLMDYRIVTGPNAGYFYLVCGKERDIAWAHYVDSASELQRWLTRLHQDKPEKLTAEQMDKVARHLIP